MPSAVVSRGPQREVKIVVLGSGGVGKSALSMQYVQSVFVEKYDPTIEDSYRKIIDVPLSWLSSTTNNNHSSFQSPRRLGEGVPSTSIILEILDTAGTDQFAAMRDLYMKNGDAFILVYSIDSLASFESLTPIVEQLLRARGCTNAQNIPILLVGNKCDLEGQRQVSKQMAQSAAQRWKFPCPPIETSARKNQNVSEAFLLLVESYFSLSRRQMPLEGKRDKKERSSREKSNNCTIN